jgi:hypothetical protein
MGHDRCLRCSKGGVGYVDMGEADRGDSCVAIYIDMESKMRPRRGPRDATRTRCADWFITELGALCRGLTLSLAVNDSRYPMSTEAEVLREFVDWCRAIAKAKCGKQAKDTDVVLIAHNGFSWDFEMLARMFVSQGMEPPVRYGQSTLCQGGPSMTFRWTRALCRGWPCRMPLT